MRGLLLLALVGVLIDYRAQSVDPSSKGNENTIGFTAPPFVLPPSLRDSVRFGWLDVPQDHGDSAAGRLRLAFSVLPARATSPEPDPIIFIPGGPGMAAVEPWTAEAARSPRIAFLRERRDYIILDPRGHGLSQPQTCPELDGTAPLTEDSPNADSILGTRLRACRARMEAAGFQVATLNAVQAAHDIEWLRRALGAEKVNLFGGSYGTRIAAEVLRRHGTSIRSVVFLSPVPPGVPHLGDDADVAVEVYPTLFRRCEELPSCQVAFPNLAADYDSVINRIRRKPLRVRLPISDRLPDGVLTLTEKTLQEALAGLLTSREVSGGAPMLLHTLAVRGLEPVLPMAPHLLQLLSDDDAFGTNLAFHCNDSPVELEKVSWLRTRCPPWVGEGYGDRTFDGVHSDVPALIMVGELDPRTPPRYARHLAAGLTRSQLVEVPWHSHDLQHPCLSRIQRDFFDRPGVRPSTTCLDSLPPIRFATGVIPSRWISSAAMRLGASPLSFVAAGVPATLLLVSLLGLPLDALRKRSRAQPMVRQGEYALLWVTSAVALALLVGAGSAILVGGQQTPLLPALGVPPGWNWVLALPWIVLLLTAASVMVQTRRAGSSDRPQAVLRITAVGGAVLVVGLWAVLSLP